MHGRRPLRAALAALVMIGVMPLHAQGSENAIGAAVVFGAVVLALVIAGLIITVLYLFKRRPWQRVVVLLFGAALLLAGLWIGKRPGGGSDVEFLQLLLGGAGVLFLLLGSILRSRLVRGRAGQE